jgi:diadenosine tetraphosphatase ApaH/serine/threonine PP2A family protein phosphatase
MIGCDSFFGQTAIATFLTNNNLLLLIRGHQYVYTDTEMFKDMVMTVFSTRRIAARIYYSTRDSSCAR